MNPSLTMILAIGAGSAIGGMARFGCSLAIDRMTGGTFPFGTIAVNVLGSFAIGFLAAATAPEARFEASALARQFLMTGCLGGFTTFSAFSLQTLALLRDGDLPRAFMNVAVSVVACVASAWLGHVAATTLGARPA